MVNNCNTCGSADKKFLFNIGEHTLVRCGNCNLVYIENPLNPSEAKDYYEIENYTGYDGTASTSDYVVGEYFRLKEANDRLDQISKVALTKVASILDVGCGAGFFVKVASQRGIRAVGVDVSQKAVEYGKIQGLDLREADLLSFNDFANESFDVITFWASLINLYHPKETLQKAYKLLKANGLIVIEVGDIDSYQARIFKKKWRLNFPYNNFHYSSSTLDDLLERTGFKTIRTDNHGFIESLVMQSGFKKLLLNVIAKNSRNSKNKISYLKEIINKITGKMKLGDVMIKYARKNKKDASE